MVIILACQARNGGSIPLARSSIAFYWPVGYAIHMKKIISIDAIRTKIIPILERNDIAYAGIFGSVARGEARDDSDIDLMIRFRGKKSLFDLVGTEQELSEALGQKVDLVTEQGVSRYLKPYILKDLKVIYQR